jgi:hypothetical protein
MLKFVSLHFLLLTLVLTAVKSVMVQCLNVDEDVFPRHFPGL